MAASRLSTGRRLKKLGVRLLTALIPGIYVAYMKLVVRTSRVTLEGLDEILERRERGDDVVVAILHQDVFLSPYVFRGLDMLSFSNVGDAGDLMSALLERCGFRMVRGGTSSRASRQTPVVQEIVSRVRRRSDGRGEIVAVAPDGSRGPAGAINAGLVLFSMKLGADVYCARIQAKRALYLDTWDRTAIPLPFNELRLGLRGPFATKAKMTRVEMERSRQAIEDAFHELHREGFESFGQAPVPELSRQAPFRRDARIAPGERARRAVPSALEANGDEPGT